MSKSKRAILDAQVMAMASARAMARRTPIAERTGRAPRRKFDDLLSMLRKQRAQVPDPITLYLSIKRQYTHASRGTRRKWARALELQFEEVDGER